MNSKLLEIAEAIGVEIDEVLPVESLRLAVDGLDERASELLEELEDDPSDSELEEIASGVSDEEIESEMDDPEEIEEALSRQTRIRMAQRFKKTAVKRDFKKKIALQKKASSSVLNRRARRAAIAALKKKLLKKPLSQMNVSDKMRAERLLSTRKKLITRLAMKMLPRVRAIQNKRLGKE